MGRNKKGFNEIKIKLLPEKAKRDYILRLVSSIIALIFLIINIVFVYLPYNKLNNELNDLRNSNSVKKLEIDWLNDKLTYISHDIYHYNNETLRDLLSHKIDFLQIFKLFQDGVEVVTFNDVHDNLPISDQIKPQNKVDITPVDSIVERIYYNEKDAYFIVSYRFTYLNSIDILKEQIGRIYYVKSVTLGNISESNKTYSVNFTIYIDPTHDTCPKVSDVDV